jgi:hypothetical protein
MDFKELKELVEVHCTSMLDLPGEVYFGSEVALQEPNGVAIIGLNPGGVPEGGGVVSLRGDMDRWARNPLKANFSGFLDVCWHEPEFSRRETCSRCKVALSDPAKKHVIPQRHQATVIGIAGRVGFDLRKTLALNAVWLQTKDADTLHQRIKMLGYADLSSAFESCFFPVIRALFESCSTRLVLCLGNGQTDSSFSLLRGALRVSKSAVVEVGGSYRDGRFFLHEGVVYFGIAHPSMHTPTPMALTRLQELWQALQQ